MPDELDHEVIDSPQALFRHLYEAHGLVEALDLDPETAPLQFWLRSHAELERAAARDRLASADRAAPGPSPTGASAEGRRPAAGRLDLQDRLLRPARSQSAGRSAVQDRPVGTSLGTPAAAPATPSPAGRGGGATSRNAASPGGTAAQGSGPRFRPFADPLVEALATALVGRGLDERHVRRGLSTFTAADGRHGEEAVRAVLLTPMLDALTAHLTGAPKAARWPQPPPETPPWPPAGQAPVGASPTGGSRPAAPPPPAGGAATSARGQPPAAEHETWVAQPLAARGPGPEPEPDYMAIADVLQERRRSRRGGRREAPKPSRTTASGAPPPSATGPPPQADPNDDFMALADAIQRRRANRPH